MYREDRNAEAVRQCCQSGHVLAHRIVPHHDLDAVEAELGGELEADTRRLRQTDAVDRATGTGCGAGTA